jgi:plastocyanin
MLDILRRLKKMDTQSGVIKPEDSYTYIFEEEGTYRFSSPTHPWINGNIIHRTYLTDNLVITIF